MGFYITDPFYTFHPAEGDASKPPGKIEDSPVFAFIVHLHGPAAAAIMARYGVNLRNAVTLSAVIEAAGAEAGADPDAGGVGAVAEEIRSAAASYRAAAESIEELAATSAFTASLVATIPPPILARILRAGFEAEADGLIMLLSSQVPPEPETGGGSPG